MDKMLVNGHDAEVFQRKEGSAQRWHLYERINDLFFLIYRREEEAAKQNTKNEKRFTRIERVGLYVTGVCILSIGVLLGLGILGWDEIKPVLAAIKKVPLL